MGGYLGQKYGYRSGVGPVAKQRVIDILTLLSARLKAQQAKGHRFLMGGKLTALDFYWATFCALMKPLPPEQCPIPDVLRAAFEFPQPDIAEALDPGPDRTPRLHVRRTSRLADGAVLTTSTPL